MLEYREVNLLLECGYFNISKLWIEQSKSLSSQKTLGKEANFIF